MTPKYFYTKDTPFQWSSGPTMLTLNPDNDFRPIESLSEARYLAEKYKVDSMGKDCVRTTYGTYYETETAW
jgi:hypothetical protein